MKPLGDAEPNAQPSEWWISDRSVVVCERSAGKDRVEIVRPS
jgi:hypothetical protein